MLNIRLKQHSGAKIGHVSRQDKFRVCDSFMNCLEYQLELCLRAPLPIHKLQMLTAALKMAVVYNHMHDISPSG